MTAIVCFAGEAGSAMAALIGTFHAAGFDIEAGQASARATLLVALTQTADTAIAAATAFAHAQPQDARETLLVNIWRVPAAPDWQASCHAATMAAFTRHAALKWASRHLRVNAVTLAGEGDEIGGIAAQEVATTVLALWRWRSMTGQIIHLGA